MNPCLRGEIPVKPKEDDVRKNWGAIVNHCAIANLLCVVNLLRRSIFSTAGSFGQIVDSAKT